jgi:hypothetical protein
MRLTLSIPVLVSLLMSAAPALADCKADIQSLLQSLEAAGPYRMEMSMVANGQTTTMAADVIMPHSMHLKGEGMEMLMTLNGVWMAQGGAMQKMPDAMKDQIQGMIRQGMNLGVQAVDKAECLGRTSYEGGMFDLFKYEAKANFMGIDSSAKVSMYVDDGGKPSWLIVDGEAMGTKSVTTQKITYDDSITIVDPK